MWVEMKVSITGTRHYRDKEGNLVRESWPPAGEKIQLPKAEAEHLIEQGYAEKSSSS